MPVKYNVVGRKNPQKPNEAPKFYASAKADGEITLKAIAKEIATGFDYCFRIPTYWQRLTNLRKCL
nr:hypothetical protein [Capnocytophaga canimorsus]